MRQLWEYRGRIARWTHAPGLKRRRAARGIGVSRGFGDSGRAARGIGAGAASASVRHQRRSGARPGSAPGAVAAPASASARLRCQRRAARGRDRRLLPVPSPRWAARGRGRRRARWQRRTAAPGGARPESAPVPSPRRWAARGRHRRLLPARSLRRAARGRGRLRR